MAANCRFAPRSYNCDLFGPANQNVEEGRPRLKGVADEVGRASEGSANATRITQNADRRMANGEGAEG